VIVETFFAVGFGEGEVIVVAGVDDTPGELPAGAGSMMVSTVLEL
jgi:hypothetical protein